MTSSDLNIQTRLAQAIGIEQPNTEEVIPPTHISTTYVRDVDNEYRSGLVYGRPNNPTVQQVEGVLSGLEHGTQALLFASGMAAATAVFQALQPGDHVIAPKVMYWSLRNWLAGMATEWGLQVTFVDMTKETQVQAAMRANKTKIIWVETPANPMWVLSDIRRLSHIAHAGNAKLVVDSTVATPILTQPLALGADIVMHSATKYLNGHTDVLGGALVTAVQDAYWERVIAVRSQYGGILSPRDAAQLMRGMRTLQLRVQQSCQSAQIIAEHFETHPNIAEVLYPGLKSHPQHQLAKQQMQGGFSGMLSIRLNKGEQAAITAAAKVKLWKRATSLGGVESLIEHRASIEGENTPVPFDLLRLSAGIEAVEDLISDLEQAL